LSPTQQKSQRLDYFDYVFSGPSPRIVVMQDLDGTNIGFGAFWGEVNSTVHKALGCIGVITDGSIRDIPQWAPGFQVLAGTIGPSHAHVHLDGFGKDITVAGMKVRSGDLVHADRHGAIVVPFDAVEKLPTAAELCARREKVILDVCRSPKFSLEKLKAAVAQSGEIH
jgi:regulator of RNase E activity RraA